MKPLIVMTNFTNDHCLSLGLENLHVNLQNDPYLLIDKGNLSPQIKNQKFKRSKDYQWKKRLFNALKHMNFPSEKIITVPKLKPPKSLFKEFSSIKELKKYTFNDVPYGSGAVSDLISVVRDHQVDVQKYKDYIHHLLVVGYSVHECVAQLIQQKGIDHLFLTRARCADQRSLIDLADKLGITYTALELNLCMHSYLKSENALVHSLDYHKKSIEKTVESFDIKSCKEPSSLWFREQRYGGEGHQINYLYFSSQQTSGLLPKTFDRNKRNIVFYSSSIDEYESIPGWENNFFSDENAGITSIVKFFADRKEFHFYLRVHPHLSGVRNSQIRTILEMEMPNLTVIPPEEKIDSYYLLENCEKAIVFSSTIGIEGCFWGKPVIALGQTFYQSLDCCYRPKNFVHALELIEMQLEPKPQQEALKYAYFVAKRGVPFKHYSFTVNGHRTQISAKLNNNLNIKEKIIYKLLRRIDRIESSISKSK